MGAWGSGIFEDDSALDFMGFLEDAENPQEAIGEALGEAITAGYLDYDEGAAALVAAAYVDAVLNGTKYSTPDMEDGWAVDDFAALHPDIDLRAYRQPAIKALEKVLSDDSELNVLWAENGKDNDWRRTVEALETRLASPPKAAS